MGKIRDLTGQKFGKLTVLAFDSVRSYGKKTYAFFLCRCDCGNEKTIRGKSLVDGNTTSCGCVAIQRRRQALNTVKVGDKFGKLTVEQYLRSNGKKASLWLCMCECGRTKEVTTNHLTQGGVTSCGCILSDKFYLYLRKINAKRPEQETNDWRVSVYKKDGYTCQCCSNKNTSLHAHHIVSWSKAKARRFDVTNGVTLCKYCHRKFHNLYGNDNNEEQLIEFKFLMNQ